MTKKSYQHTKNFSFTSITLLFPSTKGQTTKYHLLTKSILQLQILYIKLERTNVVVTQLNQSDVGLKLRPYTEYYLLVIMTFVSTTGIAKDFEPLNIS
jgi:hypothetical protein